MESAVRCGTCGKAGGHYPSCRAKTPYAGLYCRGCRVALTDRRARYGYRYCDACQDQICNTCKVLGGRHTPSCRVGARLRNPKPPRPTYGVVTEQDIIDLFTQQYVPAIRWAQRIGHLGREDAADVVQDAFELLVRRRAELWAPPRVGLLFEIVKRKAWRWHEYAWRRLVVPMDFWELQFAEALQHRPSRYAPGVRLPEETPVPS